MKCPDCGSDLVKVAVMGFDESQRCGNCGGVFMAGWVLNRIAQNPEEKIMVERINKPGLHGGTGNCPTDGNKLALAGGEELPVGMQVKKCDKCGWWWLPDDQVFEMQKAYGLRKEYQKMWNPKPKWQTMVWPAIISLVLTVGLVGGVGAVRQKQATSIGAEVGIRNWEITNLGQGKAQVSFVSGILVDRVQYKNKAEGDWQEAVVSCVGDKCTGTLVNLAEKGDYMVRVLGKEYLFKVQ